jgi:YhcH/YjgK/YiaL family protein
MSGYDNEKDFRLYHVEDYSSICLKQGMVCILYPTDLHAPGLDFLGKAMIKKCVLKVRVEL